MKMLKRNLTEFEYLAYLGETDVDPETGMHTGEPTAQYGEPEWYEGNISVPSLMTNPTYFGTDIRYTHVLLMDDPEAEIKEYGLIRWEGDMYEIRAVRPSYNVLSIALRKQTKNHAETEEDQGEPEEPGDEPGDGEEP